MLLSSVYVALGLGALIFGGHILVSGAIRLAEGLKLSPLFIGSVVLGFGTSLPELVTSLNAALAGAPGIALGNVAGSNIANILLILGAGAAVSPIAAQGAEIRRDAAWMLAATVALAGLVLLDGAPRWAGLGLLAGLAAYLMPGISGARQGTPEPGTWRPALPALLGGFALAIAGAHFLVLGGTDLARDLGVSEAVIGLTIVAVGTSLPELATTIAAAMKGRADLAVGNVVGSNIFNVLGILGITALIAPLSETGVGAIDAGAVALSGLLLGIVLLIGLRLGRLAGGALLLGYGAYLTTML